MKKLMTLVLGTCMIIAMSACSAGKAEIVENVVREFFLTNNEDIVDLYEERYEEMKTDDPENEALVISDAQFLLDELNPDLDMHFDEMGAKEIVNDYGLYQYYSQLNNVEVDSVNIQVLENTENDFNFTASFRYDGESKTVDGNIRFDEGLIVEMTFDDFNIEEYR